MKVGRWAISLFKVGLIPIGGDYSVGHTSLCVKEAKLCFSPLRNHQPPFRIDSPITHLGSWDEEIVRAMFSTISNVPILKPESSYACSLCVNHLLLNHDTIRK